MNTHINQLLLDAHELLSRHYALVCLGNPMHRQLHRTRQKWNTEYDRKNALTAIDVIVDTLSPSIDARV